MSIGTHFEHQLIRKYVAVFGTLFNDIFIGRSDGSDAKKQFFKVPLEYGPKEKFLAAVASRPKDRNNKAITLPRMSFELTGMSYDAARAKSRMNKIVSEHQTVYQGHPWNFNFQLSVMTKNNSDATKIVEQVLTYFRPDYTVDVQLLDGFNHLDRIGVIYNDASHEDVYEGDFQQRRALIWTFNFTLKGFLYGPLTDKKVIKFINVDVHGGISTDSHKTSIQIQPGMDANGAATTDITETVPYVDIDVDDDWDYIIQYTDHAE